MEMTVPIHTYEKICIQMCMIWKSDIQLTHSLTSSLIH